MNVAASAGAAPKFVPSRPRHRWLLGAATISLASALALGPALAQDFTVVAGPPVGPQNMNTVGDRGVIEAGGTVRANGESAVDMLAADQVLENFGLIETLGIAATGIYSNEINATITNFGTVSATDDFGYGISSYHRDATITNLGTISTAGFNSHGIYSDTNAGNATITNSGRIETTGLASYGIVSQGIDATIINSGSIATTDFGFGIRSGGDNATIINSGTITTANNDAHGIVSDGLNAVIMNSGTIATGGNGIASYEIGATVTNSGTIRSEQWDAIRFNQGDATLNLLAGSVIEAGIVFTGTGNTVSFGPGLNTLLTFSGAGIPGTILTSGNPYAVDGNTVAVLDRSGFALSDDMALTLAGDVAGMTGAHGQCVAAPDGELPAGDEVCATEAWLAGFGGYSSRPDSHDFSGYEYASGGAFAGLEFTPGGGVSGGIFLGAVAAEGTVGESQDTTQTGGVVGGHAGFEGDGYFADFYAALGVLQIDSERTVADNTVDGGLALASASEAGYFISPAVTVGTDLDTGAGMLTPSLRLRYTGMMLDGYAEDGADGLEVDERMVHELELRAQLALALTPSMSEAGTLSAVLRAGADVFERQSDTITGELLGQDIAFTAGEDGTAYRGFAALDLDLALSGGTSLFGNVELGLDSAGGYSATAQAGIGGAF